MTHTLHRRGDAEGLKKDYVFLLIPARKHNDVADDLAERMQEFFRIGLKNGCINIGNASTGNQDTLGGAQAVIDSTTECATIHCVFDDEEKALTMLKDLKKADLGLSIVLSGLFDHIGECCQKADVIPHTVEYSLGVWGNVKRLPSRPVMEINTMCGHGMVSVGRIHDVLDKVKAGKMTTEQGGRELGKTCTCGIFNWRRAADILEKMARQ